MKTITPENYCVIFRVSAAIFAKSEGTRRCCDDFLLTSVSDKCACSPPHFVMQEESNPNSSKSVRDVSKSCLFDLKGLKTKQIRGEKYVEQIFILKFQANRSMNSVLPDPA
jgi:hypothetical protein